MNLTILIAHLALWSVVGLLGQPVSQADRSVAFKDYFDVSSSHTGMRLVDCTFQAGRFYFLFTGVGKSELVATDIDGRVTARRAARTPANHLYSRCYLGGAIAAHPARGGTTILEEYSTDLDYVKTFVVPGEFVGGLCLPGGFAGLGPGTLTSIDAATAAVRSGSLPAGGDDPVLAAQAGPDSFVILRQFSGILQQIDHAGRLENQTALAGPGLNQLRAVREAGEGLFAPTIASDRAGVFVILGRHSPDTGLRLQRYTFGGRFVAEWQLPHLTFEEFKKARQTGALFSNSNGSLLIGRLFVVGGFAYNVDTVNKRVVRFWCGQLCGE